MKKTKHSKHRIRFHLILIPKRRKEILFGIYKTMLEDLIYYKTTVMGGCVHEFAVQPDHIHLFFEISPDVHLSKFIGQLKQYMASQMMKSFPELKQRAFFARGYFLGSCGVDASILQAYIRGQR